MGIAERIERDLLLPEGYVRRLNRSPSRHYNRFYVGTYKHGRRLVVAPDVELKLVQYWIADFVCEHDPIDDPEHVMAYEPGSSIVSNAEAHRHNAYLLTLDIKQFFAHCRADDVEGYFCLLLERVYGTAKGGNDDRWSADAEVLRRLSCYRGGLAVGSPCSPFLANRMMRQTDAELAERLRQLMGEGFVYTRYSDDLSISSARPMDPRTVAGVVREVLEGHGFELNERKTRYRGRGARRCVTGIYLLEDGRLSIGTQRKRKLRNLLYRYNRHVSGQSEKESDDEIDLQRLLGFVRFCRSVEPGYVDGLLERYESQLERYESRPDEADLYAELLKVAGSGQQGRGG